MSMFPDMIDGSGDGSSLVGGPIGGGTVGSVLFVGAGPIVAQDNTNFFWDDANNRLGIGNATPAQALHVVGTGRFSAGIRLDALTQGSVLFSGASGALSQDNAKFFWDDTNDRLGIGNATPAQALHVTGTGRFSAGLTLDALTQGSVLFSGASGVISQDNTNLFFNDTTNSLGVGTASPGARVHTLRPDSDVAPGIIADITGIEEDCVFEAAGLLLRNPDDAALNLQSWSPPLVLEAQVWESDAAASREVCWAFQNRTTQGNDPYGELVLLYQFNAGGNGDIIRFAPPGAISQVGYGVAFQYGSLGAVTTDASVGILLVNSAGAGAGAQQYSPLFVLEAQGRETSTNTSDELQFGFQVIPVQDTAVRGALHVFSNRNDGGFVAHSSFAVDASGNAQLFIPDGAVGTPGLSFSGDTNTGLYRTGADSVGVVVGGSAALTVGAAGTGSKLTYNALGAVTGDASVGLLLTNDTAATSGNQSYSPMTVWEAQAFQTGSSTSQELQFWMQAIPTQAAAANGRLIVGYNVNDGGFTGAWAFSVDASARPAFHLPDGVAAAPALSWTNDTDTGIRRSTSNTQAIVCGGADQLVVSTSAITCTQAVVPNGAGTLDLGSSTAEWKDGYFSGHIYLDAGNNDGLHVPTDNNIAITLGGTEVMRFGPAGTGSILEYASIGATTADADLGLLISCSTAATNGAVQYSPMLVMEGQCFETGGSTSQEVQFGIQCRPVQGTTAYANLTFFSNLNDGGFNNKFLIDTTSTATHTSIAVWDVDAAALVRVTVGGTNSGGSGFKLLRVPN